LLLPRGVRSDNSLAIAVRGLGHKGGLFAEPRTRYLGDWIRTARLATR
jgi:hypothetical protein